MALTETWLLHHKEAELHIEGYQLFRCDRKRIRKTTRGRLSGGAACYVKSDLASTMEISVKFSNGVVEILGLYSKVHNLYIAVIYRQPDDSTGGHRSTEVEFNNALEKLHKSLSKLPTPTPNIIFCGDFNMRQASWPDGSPSSTATSVDNRLLQCLTEITNEHFLTQHITTPTHVEGGVLDLVFSNNSHIVHSYNTLKPLRSTSDHYVIEVNTPIMSKRSDKEEEKPEFISPFSNLNFFSNDIDWEKISSEIKLKTDSEFLSLEPSTKLQRLLHILLEVCAKYVPVRRTSKKMSTFIPRHRRILMRKRRKITTQYENAPSNTRKIKLREKLVKIELLLQASHTEAKERKEQLAVKAIKTNPRFFFAYAKQFSVTKTKVGPLLNKNNEFTDSSYEMANILSEQYASVFSVPSGKNRPGEIDNSIPILDDIAFTEKDIINAIDELRDNSASGPEGLAAILLKKCKESLAKPLYSLWRDCLDHGITPSKLKEAHVIPVHKGGSQSIPSNYRPIALTSHLIKIFEKVVRNNLVQFLEENNLFNKNQHGFRLGRSCLSQLLDYHDKIISSLEAGFNVDSVYLDFSKAFDKVDHQIVLAKLSLIGIRGKLLLWIESFLTSRMQHVMVNGVFSSQCPVVSGVPQGSVLGPLLFLVLLSDIDSNIVSSCLASFADDTRLWKGISGVNDASALQRDLEIVYQWAEDNNMSFNNLKFENLRFGPDSTLKATTNYTSPCGTIIDTKEHVRDLGVTMSSDGTFSEHIQKICLSARNMCSWILRTFSDRSSDLMLTTWKSLVLPILDYCSQLWCPLKKGDIQLIEDVQKAFTRKIPHKGQDYWERLRSLHLYSLERRRERYPIIYVWKMLEHIAPNLNSDSNQIKSYTSLRHGRRCVVPPISNAVSPQRRNLREGSFAVHGSRLFNVLPQHLRNMTNVELQEFKKKT